MGLITLDRGYDPANVIAARTRIPDPGIRPDEWTVQLVVEIGAARSGRRDRGGKTTLLEALLDETERMSTLSGVAAVGVSSGLPLTINRETFARARVVGRPAPSDASASPRVRLRLASPGYFDAMRLRLRRGRLFTRLDGAGSPRVLVVNETFAREVFGGEPAVGQRVRLRPDDEPWEVIGVVADIRYRGLTGAESIAEGFVPALQSEAAPAVSSSAPFITVRTIGDPLALIPFLREAVAAAHPRAPIEDVMTMDARLSTAVAQPRFYAGFVDFFAALAVFLAAAGIYGLLSYTVAQRRREIGIRMALGAQRGDILALVVGQGAALIAAGAVAGVFAAAASSRVLESFLFGVTTDDRLTFVAAPLVLVAVALVARLAAGAPGEPDRSDAGPPRRVAGRPGRLCHPALPLCTRLPCCSVLACPAALFSALGP